MVPMDPVNNLNLLRVCLELNALSCGHASSQASDGRSEGGQKGFIDKKNRCFGYVVVAGLGCLGKQVGWLGWAGLVGPGREK